MSAYTPGSTQPASSKHVDLIKLPERVPNSPLLRHVLQKNGCRATLCEVIAAGLYDPDSGYYSKHIRTVGRRGDFSTTPVLTPLLGHAIGNWAARRASDLNLPGKCGLIELGPGSGELFSQTWSALGWWRRGRFRPALVEISSELRQIQQQRLSRISATWHSDVAEALNLCGGRAVLWAHEFADAFAPKIYQLHQGCWHELLIIHHEDGHPCLALEAQPTQLSHIRTDWPEGQRVEVPSSFVNFLRQLRPHFQQGVLLILDYGGSAREIYHRRPKGTLRSYRHHQRAEGITALADLGRRDLTFDVDFDYLATEAAKLGFRSSEIINLGDFLRDHTPVHWSVLNEHITSRFYLLELRADNEKA